MEILVKNQNQEFDQKIKILVKNRNVDQKSKVWTKIKTLTKYFK